MLSRPARLLLLCLRLAPLCALLVPRPAAAADDPLRQVAGILDYIGADYGVAVNAQGKVVNELEYEEQFNLTREALSLAREAGLPDDDPVIEGLKGLEKKLEDKPPPERILERCKRIRKTLVEEHDVQLEPRTTPVAERGRSLYAKHGCASCHGKDGGAETEQAKTMDPPPADFLDRERVAGVSPYRAYYAITHGVDGTSMESYGYLSEQARWDLAFWVLSLRHEREQAERGKKVLEQAGWPVAPDARTLSQLSADDLRSKLRDALGSKKDVRAALAYLRGQAPFGSASGEGKGGFQLARTKLRKGVEAYQGGEPGRARRLFVSAYLDGFEPNEPALRARDEELVAEIEQEMLGVRRDVADGKPPDEVEQRVDGLIGLLDRADERGKDRLGEGAAFAGSAAIALREGFEAVLLVIVLLGLLRKRNLATHARWVHVGWIAALVAGWLTWLAAGEALGGLQRELAEGIVALAAAGVLVLVTHWFLGQAQVQHGVGFLAKRLASASTGRWTAGIVFLLAFAAVYREAFEVVLFYKALLLEAAGRQHVVWLGAGAGLAALVVVALVLRAVGRRLKPRPFMLASSVMLALLAVMLVGKGVHALQEAAVLRSTPVALPELPAVGLLFASVEGLVVQGALALALVASAVVPWVRRRRRSASAGPSPAE